MHLFGCSAAMMVIFAKLNVFCSLLRSLAVAFEPSTPAPVCQSSA